MKTIAFWAPKGGVGKTSLAANVAEDLARRERGNGKKNVVVLYDRDPQASIVALDKMVAKGNGVTNFSFFVTDKPLTESQRAKIDYLVVDYRPMVEDYPQDESVVVMPVCACLPDFLSWKVGKSVLLNERKNNPPQLISVINKFNESRSENREFKDKFLNIDPKMHIIRDRSVYERVLNRADTVFGKAKLSNFYNVAKAVKEITALTDEILKKLK